MKLKPIEIAALAGFGWLTLQALKPKGTSGVGSVEAKADWLKLKSEEDTLMRQAYEKYGDNWNYDRLTPSERKRFEDWEERRSAWVRKYYGVGANFRVVPDYRYDLDVELENSGWSTIHDVDVESVKDAQQMAKTYAKLKGEKLRSYMLVNANTQERVQYWPDGTKIHHWER